MELNVTLAPVENPLNVQLNSSNVPSTAKNYNDLDNKPSINGHELKGDKSPKDLGLLGIDTIIPEKVSDLVNDENYISEEVDPTVPSWAKNPNKPTYTPEEIGLIVNPEGEATAKLEKIQIGDVIFSIEGGVGPTYTNIAESEEKF